MTCISKQLLDICTLTFAQHSYILRLQTASRHLHIDICTLTFAHWHLHVDICTLTFAHRHLHIDICTLTFAHRHLHIDICTTFVYLASANSFSKIAHATRGASIRQTCISILPTIFSSWLASTNSFSTSAHGASIHRSYIHNIYRQTCIGILPTIFSSWLASTRSLSIFVYATLRPVLSQCTLIPSLLMPSMMPAPSYACSNTWRTINTQMNAWMSEEVDRTFYMEFWRLVSDVYMYACMCVYLYVCIICQLHIVAPCKPAYTRVYERKNTHNDRMQCRPTILVIWMLLFGCCYLNGMHSNADRPFFHICFVLSSTPNKSLATTTQQCLVVCNVTCSL